MVPQQLSSNVFASGQVEPSDIGQLPQQGITLLVNNRPDGESPDQPGGALIEEYARSCGMEYAAIPIDYTGFTPEKVNALAALLSRHTEGVLLYCRSGTRSALLWALAQAKAGVPLPQIVTAAERAGYSVAAIADELDALAAQYGS